MSHIYKVSEWQSSTGAWIINDTSDLSGQSCYWWVAARVLDMTPANYIKWLLDTYKPDKYSWDGKTFLFSWDKDNYVKAHNYLLYINKIARNKKFIC